MGDECVLVEGYELFPRWTGSWHWMRERFGQIGCQVVLDLIWSLMLLNIKLCPGRLLTALGWFLLCLGAMDHIFGWVCSSYCSADTGLSCSSFSEPGHATLMLHPAALTSPAQWRQAAHLGRFRYPTERATVGIRSSEKVTNGLCLILNVVI